MLSKKEYINSKRILSIEGALSFANYTLANGIFLIGFSLMLGANDFQIGVLLAIPLFANLLQIVSAYILEATGTKKWTTNISLFLGRLLWIIVILMAFGATQFGGLYLFGSILLISSLLIAIGNLALLSWMKDLVPSRQLGRFFGTRNIWASLGGLGAYLLGSYLIDTFEGITIYGVVFSLALLCGIVSSILYFMLPDRKKKIVAINPQKFFGRLRIPFSDKKFTPLLRFGLFWGFAVNLSAPFFLVYMIDDLKLSFLLIAVFLSIDTAFRVYGLNLWRFIVDRFGAKPTLTIAGTVTSMIPLSLVFVNHNNYWLIAPIFIVSSVSYAGIDIALGQILFKSSPRKLDAYYLSSFSSLVGFVSALGPIAGGLLSTILKSHITFNSLKAVFIASFILRVLALPMIRKLNDPKSREVGDILHRMKTLRFASFFVNFYTLADYTSRIVLFPQKQLFILQRRAVKRLRKDVEITVKLLDKVSKALKANTKKGTIETQKTLEKAYTKLRETLPALEHAKPTVYYQGPKRVLAHLNRVSSILKESEKVPLKLLDTLKKSASGTHKKLNYYLERMLKNEKQE